MSFLSWRIPSRLFTRNTEVLGIVLCVTWWDLPTRNQGFNRDGGVQGPWKREESHHDLEGCKLDLQDKERGEMKKQIGMEGPGISRNQSKSWDSFRDRYLIKRLERFIHTHGGLTQQAKQVTSIL